MMHLRIYISLLVFTTIFSITSSAQSSGVVVLNWSGTTVVPGTTPNTSVQTLFLENASYEDGLPVYIHAVSGIFTNVRFATAEYADLTPEEANLLPASFDQSEVRIQAFSGYENRKAVSLLKFIPLRRNMMSGKTQKLVRFSIDMSGASASVTTGRSSLRTTSSSTSVLSTGTWYKISVASSGIFKIDYNFLQSLGINVNSIDPRDIRIFGNGGGMLPQLNSDFRHDDLQENHIYVKGESDGSFDANDYVLFYAQGPNTWSYNSSESQYVHSKNSYSDLAYYFITIGPGNGLRVSDRANQSGPVTTFSYYNDRQYIENDQYNFSQSGREWYSDKLDYDLTKSYNFNFAGLIAGSTIQLTSSVASNANVITSFNVKLNNVTVGNQSISAGGGYVLGSSKRNVYNVNASSISNDPSMTVTLTFSKGSSASSVGYVNYVAINARRELALYGNQTAFRVIASDNNSLTEFLVKDMNASYMIWDITNPLQAQNQLFSMVSTTASFVTQTDEILEFIAFNPSASFSAPNSVGRINNQNLHAIGTSGVPDMIIVTHPDFKNAAQRLANVRFNKDGLDVVVVTTDQVYNEFSSGAQDVTAIRDFMKMLYDRKAGNDSLAYLLLFGDCSYDYKNRINNNTNFVPVYESRETLDLLGSYSSDDYFGFLDDDEGNWFEPDDAADIHYLDIGIGRLPVKTSTEADEIVNKLIHYANEAECMGKWRTQIVFLADDGDGNLHLHDADKLATKVDTAFHAYSASKLYLGAFPQVSSPGGESCPEIRDQITRALDRGTFIFNYSGHGGETVMAQEQIVDINMINTWNNYDKLPFLITATCDFGRYDEPAEVSGSETAVLRGSGGAIGAITSTRVVYAYSNYALNAQIYNYIFKPVNGTMPRMGSFTKSTKNASVLGVNNRNFALLGDPSMMLAYPDYKATITKINSVAVNATPDTLKALGQMTLEGEIQNSSGTLLNTYNGTAYIRVYDKPSNYSTLESNGLPLRNFTSWNSVIYEGQATITSGVFSVNFIVPKDINYTIDFGKISLYAVENSYNSDAMGYYDNIIVGGSNTSAPSDNTAPVIKMFMNDLSFVFGGVTGKNPLFLANLSDDNGINISNSGVGHEIALYIDGSPTPVVLNEYYSANLDDYTSGKVKYQLKDLEPGNHSLKLVVWDTYNNPSEAYLEFVVAEDEKPTLSNVLNYPNPFSTHTTFHFDHNRAGDDIEVMIQIYSVSGKLIKTIEAQSFASKSHFQDAEWNGTDDFGDKIGKGVYVYKVTMRSLRDGSINHKYQKLVILN